MSREHEARIYWSDVQVERGLPAFDRTIDPAWFTAPGRGSDEGWSLMCEFAAPPALQGSPSVARVKFMVDQAPHERLVPGTRLELLERGTLQRAQVEILD
jgi:hypothetical protein